MSTSLPDCRARIWPASREGFDRLVALAPHEIQVGMLKRLRGAPIARHTEAFGMVYGTTPPYQVVRTGVLDDATVARLARFARYWDLVANSGRFRGALSLVLAADPFARFMDLADWIYAACGRTHAIPTERLYELVHRWLVERGADPGVAASVACR
jgi:hypothetical protein